MQVDFVDRSMLVNRQIKSAMKNAMTDITLDMKRVASQSAPHDTGFLEKSAQHEVFVASGYIEGQVGFSAVENGFNYAEWTNEKQYKLGAKSAKKSGGKSKFGGATVPVGTGYLTNALQYNRTGYMAHLRQAYHNALDE